MEILYIIVVAIIILLSLKDSPLGDFLIPLFQKKYREKFAKQYSSYAYRTGLTYNSYLDGITGFYDRDFRRMRSMGHNPSREFCITGSQGDIQFNWGFYHYHTTETRHRGRGRHSRGYSYTVDVNHYESYCMITCPFMDIPYFFARDENMILDSIGSMFGGQDIDFDSDKAFSSSFVLQGDSEDRIRKAFSPEVRRLFTTLAGRGLTFEGYGDAILILGGKSDLNERIELNKTAIKIANAFINNPLLSRGSQDNGYDDIDLPPIQDYNNVNKRLNPHVYNQMTSDNRNTERKPLPTSSSPRGRTTLPQRGYEQPQVKTEYEKRLAQERGAKQQRNVSPMYQQTQNNNRYSQSQTNNQRPPINQNKNLKNNTTTQPNTDISKLKGKPGLLEILNQNRR